MNNRRGISAPTRILVDTSFLLPALGLEVEGEVYEAIKHFHRVEVCYIEACMLEAMWKVLKLVSEREVDLVKRGIEAIRNSYTIVTPGAIAFSEAYSLYHEVHKDFIDNLLYAVSYEHKIPFLTIDRKFIQILESKGKDTSNLVIPEIFAEAFER
ncbi:PIN domain-containing protein [Candidatus Bathyarchaeota archaeon]|nr:PIN domain-containing protein [Candidatus Bathyarchaeota archaeon]